LYSYCAEIQEINVRMMRMMMRRRMMMMREEM